MTGERVEPRTGPALALTALAYAVCHHLGSLPEGLGQAGRGTRWTDWLDLAVPLLVLGPAVATLLAARAPRRTWAFSGVGAWLYLTGHGIHLAANSIGNVAPGPTAHLWDEQVGHWLWYAGVAVVAGALASTATAAPVPRHPVAWLLAVAVGATWGTNATGGEFTWPGLVLAAGALAWGARHRRSRAVLLALAGAVALLVVPLSAALR